MIIQRCLLLFKKKVKTALASIELNKPSLKKAKIDLIPLDDDVEIFEFHKVTKGKSKVVTSSRFKLKFGDNIQQSMLKWCHPQKSVIDVANFLEKESIIIDTPDDVKLSQILIAESRILYAVPPSDFKSEFLLSKMLNWFKMNEDSPVLLSEKDERIVNETKMISLRNSAVSTDFQNQSIVNESSFSRNVIDEMATQLKVAFENFNTEDIQIVRMKTTSPMFTATKVLAATKQGIFCSNIFLIHWIRGRHEARVSGFFPPLPRRSGR